MRRGKPIWWRPRSIRSGLEPLTASISGTEPTVAMTPRATWSRAVAKSAAAAGSPPAPAAAARPPRAGRRGAVGPAGRITAGKRPMALPGVVVPVARPDLRAIRCCCVRCLPPTEDRFAFVATRFGFATLRCGPARSPPISVTHKYTPTATSPTTKSCFGRRLRLVRRARRRCPRTGRLAMNLSAMRARRWGSGEPVDQRGRRVSLSGSDPAASNPEAQVIEIVVTVDNMWKESVRGG